MGFHVSCWPLSKHPLSLGMGVNHFMYRKKESFLFKELERFLCLKYVFLFRSLSLILALYSTLSSHPTGTKVSEGGLTFFCSSIRNTGK